MEYQSMFRCRLCGKIYKEGCTGNEDIAMKAVMDTCLGKPLLLQQPNMTQIHCCKNGSYGVADFQGFRKVVEKNEHC